MQANKLGWITSLTIMHEPNNIDVTAFGESKRSFIQGGGLVRGSMDFMASDPGALVEFMQDLQSGRDYQPTYQKEFMCLYCGSPNKIEHTHCKKCGAPRSFVIG